MPLRQLPNVKVHPPHSELAEACPATFSKNKEKEQIARKNGGSLVLEVK